MDDEFESGPKQPKKAKAKAKAKGKSRPGKGSCLCCSDARHANTRFCKVHKRAYDSMAYQAKKAEEGGVSGAKEAFNKAMSDDFSAKQEIDKFCELNPPDQRYSRKAFLDWADFRKSYGQRTDVIDRSKCKPMWEGEFMLWAQNEKALSKSEAESWWKEYFNDPRVERDHDGYKGRLQLWIPAGHSRLTDKSTYIDSATSQGCKPLKDPKPEDVQMLQAHVKRQRQSVVDGWFTNPAIPAPASVTSATSGAAPGSGQDGEATPEVPDPKKPKIDVDRAGPKLVKSMEKELDAIRKKFSAAKEKCANAMKELNAFDASLLVDDLSILGLMRSLDLRLHFLCRWDLPDEETDDSRSFVSKLKSKFEADAALNAKVTGKMSELMNAGVADFQKMKGQKAMHILKENQARLPFKESDQIASEKGMQDTVEAGLNLRSVQQYEDLKANWQCLSGSAGAISNSIAKVAADVSEHLSTKVRESKRLQKRRANQQRQEALKEIRETAKSAAEEIKAKGKVVAPKQPVFSMEMEKLTLEQVKVVDASNDSWDLPWVFKDWTTGVQCLQDHSFKKSLDTFGSQYQKLGDASGRHQYSLQSGAVKTMMEDTLKQGMPGPGAFLDLDSDEIENASKFMGAVWYYGYSPGMNFVGLQPNAAAQLRLHAKGTASVILFKATSVKEKVFADDASLTYTKVSEFIESLTVDKLDELKGKGVKIFAHTLQQNHLLFIPTGWVSVEQCEAGCGEVCGVRKSFFPLTLCSCEEYNAVLQLFAADGRSVGQMGNILKAMRSSTAALNAS